MLFLRCDIAIDLHECQQKLRLQASWGSMFSHKVNDLPKLRPYKLRLFDIRPSKLWYFAHVFFVDK